MLNASSNSHNFLRHVFASVLRDEHPWGLIQHFHKLLYNLFYKRKYLRAVRYWDVNCISRCSIDKSYKLCFVKALAVIVKGSGHIGRYGFSWLVMVLFAVVRSCIRIRIRSLASLHGIQDIGKCVVTGRFFVSKCREGLVSVFIIAICDA